MNKLLKSFNSGRTVKGALAALSLAAAQAHAAVPADVTSAMTDAKADSLTIAGLALVVIIAIAGFKYMRRAV